MKRISIGTLTAVALIMAVHSAFAGWYDAYGYYHCVWGYGPYGYACY